MIDLSYGDSKTIIHDPTIRLTNLIIQYYNQRGLKWPNPWQALAWAHTELGEAYECMLAASGGWTRNNPQDHPEGWDKDKFGEELGDAVMMLVVAGIKAGVDVEEILRAKIRRKLEEKSRAS